MVVGSSPTEDAKEKYMRKVQFYQITYNADLTEGKGQQLSTNIAFENQGDALEFVKTPYYRSRYGIMGAPGEKWDVKKITLEIYDSVLDFFQAEKQVKAEALRKVKEVLSPAELKLLNL